MKYSCSSLHGKQTNRQTDRHLKNSINHSKIPFFGFIHSNIKCFGLIIVCDQRHIKMHFEHFGKKKCQTTSVVVVIIILFFSVTNMIHSRYHQYCSIIFEWIKPTRKPASNPKIENEKRNSICGYK